MVVSVLLASSGGAAAKFAGSSVTLRHTTNARGLDASADLTWNPYAAAVLSLSPVYSVAPKLTVSANWDLEAEYTQRDAEARAFSYGDPSLTLAHGEVYRHRITGVTLSASSTLRAGVSPSSRAKTRYGALTVGLGASKAFKWRQGASVSVGLSATGYSHGARYGSPSLSLYSSSSRRGVGDRAAGACAEDLVINSGSANAYGGVTSSLTGSLKLPMKTIPRARLGGTWIGTYAHDLEDERISFAGPPGTSLRALLFSDLRVGYAPKKQLALALGMQTAHPQLGANGTYRTPFINRYSNLYLDVTARY